jgi:hypothetical protein
VPGDAIDREERTSGLGLSAALAGEERSTHVGVLVTAAEDPNTFRNHCCGNAVPVLANENGQYRASYTYCAIWQEEKDMILEGRDELFEDPEVERTAMGVPDVDEFDIRDMADAVGGFDAIAASRGDVLDAVSADPWEQARRDLDILAPPPEGER